MNKKIIQFLKDYWYLILIVIAVVVYFVTNLSKPPPSGCKSGTTLSTICGKAQCIPDCPTGQFYACDLGVCVPSCDPDTEALAKCSDNYTCVKKDYTTTDFGIPAFDESKCQWMSGYTSDNCKLFSGDASGETFYEDCINWNNPKDPDYGKVLFGTKVNSQFKCGIKGADNTGKYNNFNIKQHTQGSTIYKTLEKGDPYSGTFSDTCDSGSNQSKSSFTDLNMDCVQASSGLFDSSGNKTKDIPTGNQFCGYDNSSTKCKQLVDCDSKDSSANNYPWKQYAIMNNCNPELDSNGNTQQIDKNYTCNIPSFMFPELGNGKCSVTSLGNLCTVNGQCEDWQGGYSYFAKSCSYDLSGCRTYLDSTGNIQSDCTDTSGIIGCRNSDKYIWNGTQCVEYGSFDIITGISDVRISNPGGKGTKFAITNMIVTFDLTNVDNDTQNIIINRQNISNVSIFVAEINEGVIDLTKKVYFLSINDISNNIKYNNGTYIFGNTSGTIQLFVNDNNDNGFVALKDGQMYYLGLIIKFDNINIRTRGFDPSNLTDIQNNSFVFKK